MIIAPGLRSSTRASWSLTRSEVYATLWQAYSFPGASFYAQARDGQFPEQLTAALTRLPYRIRASDLAWPPFDTYDDMQSEYIRLFQVGGRRGPPCSLNAGHYARDRSQTLQRLIRFYNFFGFRVAQCVMPDHLPVELEFMSELAADGSLDQDSSRRAQADFLRLHLAWTEELGARVMKASPQRFYRSLTLLTGRYLAADRRFIMQANGGDQDADR
jgi:DMSO reductase family type II enzyme chaperone